MTTFPADYNHRVYAGWLGKCIGVRFGAPIEGWTYQEIKDNLGELTDFFPLPPGKIFKPDDDTAMPMILIRALQDYGPSLTAAQLGRTWLNYLGDQRGTLWWGGYGVSTEHTAYLNLAAGIPAPKSGSVELNGAELAEQIGGQIFSDIWGLVAPNNPALAAEYAAKAASVSHAGDGIHGSIFIAALTSHAFSEHDPGKLIETGLSLIPVQSEYARVIRAVRDFHRQHPQDWHAAYRFIEANFGYNRYPGQVHIIPNAGLIAMGLLYGQGDFSRSICLTNMGGWDTDCNVGNVGAIMGVAVGLKGIPPPWRAPMNDVLVAAGIIGTRNLLTIPACADLFCDLGRQTSSQPAEAPKPRFHFAYPGSTQGFLVGGQVDRFIRLQQIPTETGGRLRLTIKKLNKKEEIRLFTKTYYRPAELSANFYGASFTPKIAPGQTIKAQLSLPAGAPEQIRAGLYVRDDNTGESLQSAGQVLTPGETTLLRYRIPPRHNALLSEVGVVLRTLGDPWNGSIELDWLDWDGPPDYSIDFSLERAEYNAISQWTFLRGYWRLSNGGYHGSGPGLNETYSGDIDWRDYSLTVKLTPLTGQNHAIAARVQGSLRAYLLGLAPENKLILYKNEGGYKPVAQTDFQWSHGQSYTLILTAKDNRLIGGVDGGPKIEWADIDVPYLNGQIGLSNFDGGHTRFETVKVAPAEN